MVFCPVGRPPPVVQGCHAGSRAHGRHCCFRWGLRSALAGRGYRGLIKIPLREAPSPQPRPPIPGERRSPRLVIGRARRARGLSQQEGAMHGAKGARSSAFATAPSMFSHSPSGRHRHRPKFARDSAWTNIRLQTIKGVCDGLKANPYVSNISVGQC